MEKKSSLWLVFDIDGVLTSGSIIVDGSERIQKSLNMKDIDAIYELSRMGCHIIAMTAEKDSITEWISNRFPWDAFYDGVKDKKEKLSNLINKNQIAKENVFYVGDGKKDISAFELAGTTICPADAISDIRDKADYRLKGNAGSGVLWDLIEVVSLRQNQNDSNTLHIQASAAKKMWLHNLEEHNRVIARMDNSDIVEQIVKAADSISSALKNGKKIVLFGNGGSAADAQHIAAEFVGKYKVNRDSLNAIALTTNSSVITAIANDFDYAHIFTRQVSAVVNQGDVVIGISTSGQSENVINGIKEARKRGAFTIMLTGGIAKTSIADLIVSVPTLQTPNIQEMHILIGHFWADYAERNLL